MKESEKPKFFLVGGANGAGKATYIDASFPEGQYEKIIPDRIQKEMGIKDSFTLSNIVGDKLRRAIGDKKNIVFEHNLHIETPFRNLEAYKKQGYETTLINLSFKEGLVNEKKTHLAEWVKKEFELPMVLAEKLGRTPKDNDNIKIKR